MLRATYRSAPVVAPPGDVPVHEAVMHWAAYCPAAPALSDAGMAVDYGELASRVRATAEWLRTLGIARGERILIVAENSVAFATLVLGAHRAGIATVLENARRAPAETDAIHAHCAPRYTLFVLDGSGDATVHAARVGAQIRDDSPAGRVAVLAGIVDTRAPHDGGVPPAAIIYTTGTTGQPKGVMLPERALRFIASQMRALRRVTPHDCVYAVLPATHVMGLASVLLGGLASGAHVHLVARFSPHECIDALARHRVTMLQGAPAMFAKLVDYCRAQRIAQVPGVRFIGSGGAPIDPGVKRDAEHLFGVPLHNGYGLTEAASTCWTRVDEDNTDDTVGRALPGVELRIAATPPDTDVGELWVRGPNVMSGYFRDPQRTADVLGADGWFNTQDLARLGADGRVYIVGRTKDMIIRSGFNVYPLEIELTLSTHPDVLHCAVLGRAVKGNEEIVAFVELAQGARASTDELAAFLAQRLSPYKRPAQIVVMASLPVAANGKVLKSALVVPQA